MCVYFSGYRERVVGAAILRGDRPFSSPPGIVYKPCKTVYLHVTTCRYVILSTNFVFAGHLSNVHRGRAYLPNIPFMFENIDHNLLIEIDIHIKEHPSWLEIFSDRFPRQIFLSLESFILKLSQEMKHLLIIHSTIRAFINFEFVKIFSFVLSYRQCCKSSLFVKIKVTCNLKFFFFFLTIIFNNCEMMFKFLLLLQHWVFINFYYKLIRKKLGNWAMH